MALEPPMPFHLSAVLGSAPGAFVAGQASAGASVNADQEKRRSFAGGGGQGPMTDADARWLGAEKAGW